jgi:serine/threonine protein kinase
VSTPNCSKCGGAHLTGDCPGVSRSFDSIAVASSEEPNPDLTLPPGAQVGEYRVTGWLGEGGMGVVYSGVHPLLGRKVAIKVLNRQHANAEATARFLQEARAASRLRHQNIVDVFAFGQMPDGHYYQVMEFLEGESLRSILEREGALTLVQARVVIVGVLGGLGAAHRAGIVHRDIKPDNIFLCTPLARLAASDVKILDFGLAKNDSGAHPSVKTRTGITMGTPAYMSPEQCRALPDIDARADIYAVGVVLYEMLAGHAPFQSDSAFDVMTMQISVPAPRLSNATGRAEPLEPVILQAMEKRAAARFDTAEEMLLAIDAALPAGAVTNYTTGSERRPPRRIGPRAPSDQPTLVEENASGPPAAANAGVPSAATQVPSRWLPRLVAGAGVGLVVAAAVIVSRTGHSARPVAAPAPAPAEVVATPLVPPGPAVHSARPPEGEAPRAVQARAIAPTHAGKSHKRAARTRTSVSGSVGAAGQRNRAETDLDSPLNPYAR